MRSFLAALRTLTLPWGRTTGARILLDGVNGIIQVFRASNAKVVEINSQDGVGQIKVYDSANGNAFYAGDRASHIHPDGRAAEYTIGSIINRTSTVDGQRFHGFTMSDSAAVMFVDSTPVGRALHGQDPVTAGRETWHDATLANFWTVWGAGFGTPGYRMMPDGTVRLRGTLKAGTTADGTVLFTLPAGYQPTWTHQILTRSDAAGKTFLQISTIGEVSIYGGAGSVAVTIDGISFPVQI